MKKIRVPVTDLYDRDIMTGEYVEPQPIQQAQDQEEKTKNRLNNKLQETNTLGKIYVEGLGYVNI